MRILTGLFCLFQFVSFASTEVYSSRLEGSSIVLNATSTTIDDKYWDMQLSSSWMNHFSNTTVTNKVQLGINPDIVVSLGYSIAVGVEITYKQWISGAFQDVIINRTLNVSTSATGSGLMDDLSTTVFNGGHHVKVRVTSISGGSVSNVFLSTQIEVDRLYVFDGAAVMNCSGVPTGVSNSYLNVSWNTKEGAESYELEWVHVNDYTLQKGVYKPSSTLSYNYYLNSTRIETNANTYQIPLIFDHGYVLYRVRGIGRSSGSRSEGNWNASEGGIVSGHPAAQVYQQLTEYDSVMNWHYSAQYAEDGKRVNSVQFSDGLGRVRQQVSSNPETGQVLVNNVYYDELGRGVVRDLVTPVDNDRMRHFPNFNLANVSGTPGYWKSYFDGVSSGCGYNSNGFATSSGAGKYYSSMNGNKDGENGSTPDAELYPFTRISYLNDFTGRVDRISSAGDTLALGSGHEQRFFYPSASQPELNALFGVEAGYASHYQKLVTVDANGQAYVEYRDMAGRVVATYLEGKSPTTLDSVSTNAFLPVDLVLLEQGGAQQIDMSVPSSELTQYEYIAIDGNYTFDYRFTPQQYTSVCASGVCLDCVYDLEITVKDECGNNKKSIIEGINGATLDGICNGSTLYTQNFTLPLTKGLYAISKKLKVNQAAIDAYWCSYIEDNSCLPTYSSVFNDLYSNEEFSSCTTPLETDPVNESYCSSHRSIMFADMRPGGQYGTYLDNGTGILSSTNIWSIYTSGNSLGGSWQSPTTPYLDESGNNVTSFVTSQGASYNDKLSYFIGHFRDEWAEGLISYHPEYCYLSFCESNSSSESYDQGMMSTYTFDVAKSTGYFKPTGILVPSTLVATGYPLNGSATLLDPFFTSTGGGAAYATALNSKLTNYITLTDPTGTHPQVNLSLWEYAIYKALNCGSSLSIASCLATFREPSCMEDAAWVIFRDLYLELKLTYYYQAQQSYASSHSCSNSCIGAQVPCTGSKALLSSYVSRWGNPSQYSSLQNSMSTGAGAQQVLSDSLQVNCQESCEQYADEWIAQLSGCNLGTLLTTTQQSNLRTDLISLCKKGCDSSHPQGSTTTPAGQPVMPGNYQTIGDVLRAYLGTSYETVLCTELLISAPGPYVSQSTQVNQLVQPLDSCGCNILFAARKALENGNLPPGVTNIETMLAYGWGISLEDADALICACESSKNGNVSWSVNTNSSLISKGFMVPSSLTCNDTEGCKTCTNVTASLTLLAQRFGYASYSAFSQVANYQTLMTNYLNSVYHMEKDPGEYLTFLAKCSATSSAPYCQINPLMKEYVDILSLLSMRGQLTNTVGINLFTNNIVYAYGELKSTGLGSTYTSSISGNTLTGVFSGTGVSACSVTLTIPTGSTFGFSDIFGFGSFYPSSTACSNNTSFSVDVSYYSCGELQTGTLTGQTSCLQVNQCICSSTGLLLCDEVDETPEFAPCYTTALSELAQQTEDKYVASLSDFYEAFSAAYTTKCSAAFSSERFVISGKFKRYQYTLYYYDQAGNLVRTVAPKGVNVLLSSDNLINAARDGVVSSTNYPAVTTQTKPSHGFISSYRYNSYNQLVSTANPDQEGSTSYWYDRYGRIVASQNPVQLLQNMYSYTLYDALGRAVQVGQVVKSAAPSETLLKTDDLGAGFASWVSSGTRSEVSITTYDKALSTAISAKFAAGVQQNLRLRVATIAYFETVGASTNYQTGYTSAIHYSYDLHGNVIEQLQDMPQLAVVQQDVKSTQYTFELISGNVKTVQYQSGKPDQYTHQYSYDQLNRLTEVYTTLDGGIHKQRQAHYFYYDHGPLARTELGQYKVQGMDYAYTINGWLKGMNSSLLNPTYDMGHDGTTGYFTANNQVHRWFAKDIISYSLGYFTGDYKAIDATSKMEATYFTPQTPPTAPIRSAFDLAASNLYNGNIRHMVTSIYGLKTQGSVYRYDQLQRLKNMTVFNYTGDPLTTNTWFGASSTTEYANSYTYDANGNILTLKRNGAIAGSSMDDLTYQYLNIGTSASNRLGYVDDAVLAGSFTDDIDDQVSGNYVYDKLGQLVSDVSEGLTLSWRKGDKKLKSVTNSQSGESDVEYVYNPLGQRILKKEKTRTGTSFNSEDQWKYTYYVYDANGQVMAVYSLNLSSTLNKAVLSEQHLYGSNRLGMIKGNITLYNNGAVSFPALTVYQNTIGKTNYELSNHLGNVEAVITDRRIWNSTSSLYEAVVVTYADYYPFGMTMPGRALNTGNYRYLYNGMEANNELSGTGNSYTTEFRQYDPRLGRWKSLDPKGSAWESPFVAMSNNPILYIDPLGDTVKYQGFMDRVNTMIGRAFNKGFREKFNENKNSTNVYTYDRSREFSSERLVNAKPCQFENKTNSAGIEYSDNKIYYNQGIKLGDVSNDAMRISFGIVVLPLSISFNAIKFPVGLISGLGIGTLNLFKQEGDKIGWGMAGFASMPNDLTGESINIFSYGFGNWGHYGMFGQDISGLTNRGYKFDGFIGIRAGAGAKKAPNFLDILPAIEFQMTTVFMHLNFSNESNRKRYLHREKIIDFSGNTNKY